VFDTWTIRRFALSNPEGDGQGDVPALLRRMADTIEGYGGVEVQDLVFHTEITAEGPWHSVTVYSPFPAIRSPTKGLAPWGSDRAVEAESLLRSAETASHPVPNLDSGRDG
jgi:hypothetical protein